MTFQPGQSGNPSGTLLHGFYKRRERACDACGTLYVARRLTSRYCSDRCRKEWGLWSFRAANPHLTPKDGV